MRKSTISGPSRRSVLLGGAAATLAAPMLPRTAFSQASTQITFAVASDPSGANADLVRTFNETNGSGIEVKILEMPARSDEHRGIIESELGIGGEGIDVLAADVVWTSQFAWNGWVRNLTNRFYADMDPGMFLNAPMNSTLFRNQMWGAPWFTDAGMIFYRKDLLEAAGIAVPTTWSELQEAANAVRNSAGITHGYVFQGAAYEGGTANACEFIWSAGGRIMTQQQVVFDAYSTDTSEPNRVSVNSAATVAGLEAARALVDSGASPIDVTRMDEAAANAAFLSGDAVFLRSWPSLYGLAAGAGSSVSQDQIGVMAIPTVDGSGRSTSCLGGWNLMITAGSSKVDAAWQFIRHAISSEAQAARAAKGAFLPVLASLYDSTELAAQVPLIDLAKTEVNAARSRPASIIYPQVSPRIALAFNRVLSGELEAPDAAAKLSDELNILMRANRG